MKLGAGTDIVSVARVAALIDARGATYLERWFTPEEIDYCSGKAVPCRHFAARLAAKEAVVKSLTLTWDGPVPWRSIEIVAEERGAPTVRLLGAVKDAAERAGVRSVQVSLAHCDDYATAVAWATSPGQDAR
jgi:holo-[acyl-carrier protein] synthase